MSQMKWIYADETPGDATVHPRRSIQIRIIRVLFCFLLTQRIKTTHLALLNFLT